MVESTQNIFVGGVILTFRVRIMVREANSNRNFEQKQKFLHPCAVVTGWSKDYMEETRAKAGEREMFTTQEVMEGTGLNFEDMQAATRRANEKALEAIGRA